MATRIDSEPDYWMANLGAEQQDPTRVHELRVGVIRRVSPLDDQLGVSAPINVPPELRDMLFTQPRSDKGSAIPTVRTYAVLDAAKLQGLPELLEASGLEYACLFQGPSEEELRDVAPWIVRLEEKNSFTRALFTHGEGPNQFWDAAAGIFIRAQIDLDSIRKHLRKFTKLRDEHNKWYYWRFWEPCTWILLTCDSPHLLPMWRGLLTPIGDCPSEFVIVDAPNQSAFSIRLVTETQHQIAAARIDTETLHALDAVMRGRLQASEAAAALNALPEDHPARHIATTQLQELWIALRRAGFVEPEDRVEAMTLYLRQQAVGRDKEAWAILSAQGPGPGVRLWRLAQAISEQV